MSSAADSGPQGSPSRPVGRSWLAWLGMPLLLGLVATVWVVVRRSEERLIGDRFGAEVDRVVERITRRMAFQVQILRGASEFISLRPGGVTRQEWKQYVASLDLDRLNPGGQGLGYAEWVPAGEVEAHVRRLRAEGFACLLYTSPSPRD